MGKVVVEEKWDNFYGAQFSYMVGLSLYIYGQYTTGGSNWIILQLIHAKNTTDRDLYDVLFRDLAAKSIRAPSGR